MENIQEVINELRTAVAELGARVAALEAGRDRTAPEPIEFEPEFVFEPDESVAVEPEAFLEPVAEAVPEPAPAPEAVAEEAVPEPAATAPEPRPRESRAWMTDITGSPISNVISAISLNDRVYIINTLFKEDPMAFQNAISKLNSFTCLEDAIRYAEDNYPEWDLGSDAVYRLMMAVRRKLKH